jgi:uncharacterized membrane protein
MLSLCEWLEHTWLISTIADTGWIYATVSVTHYFTLFVLVGTIVLVDLRVLGVAARNQSVAQIAEALFPWTWTALGLALLSGFIMFATDAGDYYPDKIFRIKMTVILLAVIFAVIVRRNVPKWDRAPVIPAGAKLVAFVSLALWIGAILAGVEIAAISGLG